ncbi:unnamed protein product [Closterium sp. Naga37s-1]|nr:unnamed protein product [Closterium sp. Naga37s-1]
MTATAERSAAPGAAARGGVAGSASAFGAAKHGSPAELERVESEGEMLHGVAVSAAPFAARLPCAAEMVGGGGGAVGEKGAWEGGRIAAGLVGEERRGE